MRNVICKDNYWFPSGGIEVGLDNDLNRARDNLRYRLGEIGGSRQVADSNVAQLDLYMLALEHIEAARKLIERAREAGGDHV